MINLIEMLNPLNESSLIAKILEKLPLKNLREKLKLDSRKMLLVMLLFFIALGYLDSFLVRLQLDSLKFLGPQLKQLNSDLKSLAKDLVSMQQLKVELAKRYNDVSRQWKRIISEEQISYVLQVVSTIAKKNNIKITQMTPSKEIPVKQEKDSRAPRLTPLGITLVLTCDYHRLGKFINDLENAEIFIAVDTLELAYQESDYLLQRANLVLKTYVKK